jgi:gamma-glutamyltranspeptidase/glutathione hydrolase
MVVTDSAIATGVGRAVLASGGNAVDAAVATAFALSVVYPAAGNLGGGGFLVARVRGRAYALDFRETAPAAATRDMFTSGPGNRTRASRDGVLAVGVPGSVAGLHEAWRVLGSKTLSWKSLVAPAVQLAEGGFEVDADFARFISIEAGRLGRYPASASLFLPNGAPPKEGTTWRNPDLAGVLQAIADQGPGAFYSGPPADAIVRSMKDGGGLLTRADLESYVAKWRVALEFSYRGHTIVSMPPPSSGGLTIAMIADQLSGWNLATMAWHSAAHVHVVAEAMRRAYVARNDKIGDPDFVNNPISELMSDGWAARMRASIREDHASPSADLAPERAPRASEGVHTTHFGIVDSDGNAVALTTTLNEWFGSGVTVPGSGFVLNNEMDDFTTSNGQPNVFGLIQGAANEIAPGKRMLSSMAPTIVLGPDGLVEFVLGAAGGSRIPTTVFEELSNAVDFGMDVVDAVRAPRFHQQDFPDSLQIEARSLPEFVRQALERMGHATKEVEHLADAPALGRDRGLWTGAAEPRRKGSLGLGL